LDLVEAGARLAPALPTIVFALAGAAGDAEYADALRARIAEAGLDRHFRLLGFQAEVQDLLSIAQALVHPSHSEGFGLAILEAMAAGLPVVATRSGGPEEIVEEGVSGLLVPVGDPPALAAALRRVLAEEDLAAALARGGRARAGAFTLAATARRTEEVYRELVESPADARADRAACGRTLVEEVLTRARRAAATAPPAAPPPPPRSPAPGSWWSRLRRRRGGSPP
jgi:glycosyltransferase involved in cell wall biosynthesis